MKSMRLLKYSFSRYYIKELFLVFQLTLMLLLAFSILSPVDDYVEMYQDLENLYSFDFSETLFFNPNVAAYQTTDADSSSIGNQIEGYLDILSEDATIDKIMRLSYNSTQILTGKTMKDPHTGDIIEEVLSANFLVYSSGYAETSNLDFLDGSLENENSSNYVSIAVSRSLSDILPIGSICEFDLIGTGNPTICMVSAILSEDCVLPSTYGFASFPALANIGTRIADVDGAHFIIAISEGEAFPELAWEYSCYLAVQNGTDIQELCNEVNTEAGTLGTFYTVSDIVSSSLYSLLQSNSELIFECVLLSLVAVFGYGGYLYLSICRRQKDFSILYIMGLTRRQTLILNTVSGMLILCVSFIIAYVTYPSFQEMMGIAQKDSLGIVSIAFCVLFFSFILLLSYIAAFHQFNKATTISLYQGGD